MVRPRRKLLWRLYPSYLLILLLSLAAVAVFASREVRYGFLQETERDLHARALLLAARLSGPEGLPPPAEIQAYCRDLGRQTSTRFTVVLSSGQVMGDTQKTPERMDNHGDRPEIKAALSSPSGKSVRYSTTLKQDMMYVAVPLRWQGRRVAAVRAAKPMQAVSDTLDRIYWRLGLGGLAVALLAALLSLFIAHRINQPLRDMRDGAARFAAGDLRFRLAVPHTEETADLAVAMNEMAAQLDDRIGKVTEQRNELEAVLSSMIDAVVVVDRAGNVARVNHAAETLLDMDTTTAIGRPMEEALRNAELHRLLSSTLESDAPQETEIQLHRGADRYLSATGATLYGPEDERVGALIVLHDLTHLRQLESVRSEFVANVSHELKTPITAIQGFVETLRDGALDDADNAGRFLDIIARHAERLNAIIEDLLALSRLERGVPAKLERQSGRIGDVLAAARQLCEHTAKERNVDLTLDGDLDTELLMSAPLLEQAVVNLCDNAIKYSDKGGTVRVTVSRQPTQTAKEVVIAVQDQGCGIPERDQSRVFERFYRVDKARSRDQGGTGLGLALVKHIVNMHQGRVSLESEPQKGTTVRIHLPCDKSLP